MSCHKKKIDLDEEILALVKTVSADSKNNSLELNEFIKMIARDIKRDATGSRDELLEAFRSSSFYDILSS